jgi:hypothetical protein
MKKIEMTLGNRISQVDARSFPERFRYGQDFKPIDQLCNMIVDPSILHGTPYYRC